MSRPFPSRPVRSREPLHRRNGKIRAREVRVLDESRQQFGVVSLNEARSLARGKGMDLIETALYGHADSPPKMPGDRDLTVVITPLHRDKRARNPGLAPPIHPEAPMAPLQGENSPA